MLGIWAYFFAVIVGGGIGLLLKGGLPKRLQGAINQALALCVLVIGVSGAIQTENAMIVIVCVVVGTLLGELLRIERGIDRMANWAQSRLAKGENAFAEGLINATLLFSVGAMAVVGSLEAGLSGKADTLLAKSALDFTSSIIFASNFGAGVLCAAVPLTIYQGAIALLAGALSPLLTEELINEMSAVGSVLIIGLSFNMLQLTRERIPVGNMLPAMFAPIAYFPLAHLLETLF